jgi:hypothetical protein
MMGDQNNIPDLLDCYFQLGYAEGAEGRNHDTSAGDAQECRSQIEAELLRLQEENARIRSKTTELEEKLKRVNRIATDKEYMLHAYRSMLGPKALELVELWESKGVTRQHTFWGPDAHKLTGEERAQELLKVATALPSHTTFDDSDIAIRALPIDKGVER